MGLVESATSIMSMAQHRLDGVARNVANIATPGYKRRISFASVLDLSNGKPAPVIAVRFDDAQGKLQSTGNTLDLAISGTGYFAVRNGDAVLHSRQGQFRRDADGSLVTPQGYALQQAGGGDLVVESDAEIEIVGDGMVLAGGQPLGRIAIERPSTGVMLTPVGDSFFTAAGSMEVADDAVVRSGMSESSNVDLGDEMTQSMVALRQAESGARLIQLYDDLMGRAVSTFGQGGGR